MARPALDDKVSGPFVSNHRVNAREEYKAVVATCVSSCDPFATPMATCPENDSQFEVAAYARYAATPKSIWLIDFVLDDAE